MAIDYDKLMSMKFDPIEETYSSDDSILYALGVGLGLDPMNEDELAFVYEKDQRVLPTMAVVLAHPGLWQKDRDTGITYLKALHGEQSVVLHRPLAPEATVIGQESIVDLIDKGEGKGALMMVERTLTDKATGELIATSTSTAFLRADGGFGGPARSQPKPHVLPERAPDMVCDLPTSAQGALIYRLCADRNPLHADPAVAQAAGFPSPILHGLATYGLAGHALLKSVCGYDPARLKSIAARFSAPVFPGETFRTEIWKDGNVVGFQVRVVERDIVAISNGRAEIGD